MACKKDDINKNIVKKTLLYELNSGIKVFRVDDCIIVKLPENNNLLTTSWINGGYKENLEAVYNHQLGQKEIDALENRSISDYMYKKAEQLDLNPKNVTGLLTAANIDNVAISKKCYRELEVTAIVTGGVTGNAGTAGDPASFYEENGNFKIEIGTINTILIINAYLDDGALTKAMTTAVEAKTVALQQLMVPSKYSVEIATGTGTDGISVISNMKSNNKLTNAGKHSKLGELIGTSVIEATKETLAKETSITPTSLCDMMVRMNRFGIKEENYFDAVDHRETIDKQLFIKHLREFSRDPEIVAVTAAILHLKDEVRWGLISEEAAKTTATDIMQIFSKKSIENFSNMKIEDHIIKSWINVCLGCFEHETKY